MPDGDFNFSYIPAENKVFELQMRKASMTDFQVLEASEGNGKC